MFGYAELSEFAAKPQAYNSAVWQTAMRSPAAVTSSVLHAMPLASYHFTGVDLILCVYFQSCCLISFFGLAAEIPS